MTEAQDAWVTNVDSRCQGEEINKCTEVPAKYKF